MCDSFDDFKRDLKGFSRMYLNVTYAFPLFSNLNTKLLRYRMVLQLPGGVG